MGTAAQHPKPRPSFRIIPARLHLPGASPVRPDPASPSPRLRPTRQRHNPARPLRQRPRLPTASPAPRARAVTFLPHPPCAQRKPPRSPPRPRQARIPEIPGLPFISPPTAAALHPIHSRAAPRTPRRAAHPRRAAPLLRHGRAAPATPEPRPNSTPAPPRRSGLPRAVSLRCDPHRPRFNLPPRAPPTRHRRTTPPSTLRRPPPSLHSSVSTPSSSPCFCARCFSRSAPQPLEHRTPAGSAAIAPPHHPKPLLRPWIARATTPSGLRMRRATPQAKAPPESSPGAAD